MPADVIMPMLGMAQETGKVLRWLKADGDSVRQGEPPPDVKDDKVTVEIEAPADGTLAGVRVPDGTEVPVGEVIALVLAEGEVAPLADTEPRPSAAVGGAVSRPGVGGLPAGASSPVREVEAVAAAPTIEQVTVPSRRRNGRLASPKARRLARERGVDLESLTGSGPNGAIVAADVERNERKRPALKQVSDVGTSNVWRVMAERTQR